MKHIAVVITARASLARVQTVLENLSGLVVTPTGHEAPRLSIVLAGSAALRRFGDVEMDLDLAGIQGNVYRLTAMEPHGRDGAAAYTGALVQELTTLFRLIRPQTVVVIADRYETLAVSIAASYQGIRLVHLLGGERSGNIDDKVRFANTALADVHCVPTEHAYSTLVCPDSHYESVARGEVHITGCPSVDLALRAEPPSVEELNAHGTGMAFLDRPHMVVLYHPSDEDTFTPNDLMLAVAQAAFSKDTQVLWFWPNIDPGAEAIEKRIREYTGQKFCSFRFYRHLPAQQFLGLVKTAKCLVGNSSVGVREAGILGTPVVNIGHRQDGRLKTMNVLDWHEENAQTLEGAIARQVEHGPYAPDFTYGDGDAGKKIVKILLEDA